MVGYGARLPTARPAGLRLTVHRRPWFRLDGQPPSGWGGHPFRRLGTGSTRQPGCTGFATQVKDNASPCASASTRRVEWCRLRTSRFDSSSSPAFSAFSTSGWSATSTPWDWTTRSAQAEDLRWATCQQLSDRVFAWYGERCQGIVYRSRTTPQRSGNLAFFAHAPLQPVDRGALQDRSGLLASCVLSDGFTVEGWS